MSVPGRDRRSYLCTLYDVRCTFGGSACILRSPWAHDTNKPGGFYCPFPISRRAVSGGPRGPCSKGCGPSSCPYSPECVEEKFSEIRRDMEVGWVSNSSGIHRRLLASVAGTRRGAHFCIPSSPSLAAQRALFTQRPSSMEFSEVHCSHSRAFLLAVSAVYAMASSIIYTPR